MTHLDNLPGHAAALRERLALPLRRVNAYPGMMIEPTTWRDAHEYHRDHARLHHLALHGWGIVQGLEVMLGVSRDTLRVQPGIGVDPVGNVIVVPQEHVYHLTTREKGSVYLVIQAQDVPASPLQQGLDGSAYPTRITEAFAVQERTWLASEAGLELARIEYDPAHGPVTIPTDPGAPGPNDLDGRFRVQLGRHSSATSVGTRSGELPPELASLAVRVDGLARRVEALAQQPGAAASSEVGALGGRLEELEQVVRRLEQAPRGALPGTGDTVPPPDGQVAALAESLEVLRGKLDELTRQVQSLDECTPATDSTIPSDDRLEPVRRQVEQLTGRLDAFAQHEDGLGRQVAVLEERLALLAQQTQARIDHLDPLAGRLARLEPEVQALAGLVQALAERKEAPAGEAARGELHGALAMHGGAGWDQHRHGLHLLLREVALSAAIVTRWLDPVVVAAAHGLGLLYLCGHAALTFGEAEVTAIRRLLEAGATVVGEGCASGPDGDAGAKEFAFSYWQLAEQVGCRLTKLERGHPLLVARHVFADPPAGGRANARVLEARGMVYSDADYGCAWQGGASGRPLPRSVIREALEFGVNLALYRQVDPSALS